MARSGTADGTDSPARAGLVKIWSARILVLLAAAVTIMVLALAVGMRLDDQDIDRHRGTATATVLSVTPLRTGVEFIAADGMTIRPPDGVLYPGLLSVGQRFMVEYSTESPETVRVAGRTASVGTIPLLLTLGGSWLVTLPVAWWLRRRSGRPWIALPWRPPRADDAASPR
ncbi:DUF3592 domain-containing protein [Nakamurella leprariae]|uniref:DUF3592 domain-containing protein n=1 Tax=Nakamurella leprariae TaxID=2803911 RepID=A0A939C0P5_9ACTN|nr:DUF3592 domain-containing protein [Nakamurella leprariae]MBM9466254.1 hypothetical protein [Nakamurella leprariae]